MDGLTLGRVVFFHRGDQQVRAARVTRVWDQEAGLVSLMVDQD